MTDKLCVFNATRESFLSLGVTLADTCWTRLRGLAGKIRLSADDGIWVAPSHGIHTIGVFCPIDVVYLDGENRVVHLVEHLGPFRIASLRLRCSSVLELPPRSIYGSNTQVGDQLIIGSSEQMVEYWNSQRKLSPHE